MNTTTIQPTDHPTAMHPTTTHAGVDDSDATIQLVAVDAIIPDPGNQTRPLTATFIESVRSNGVLQPILVCPRDDGSFDLVAGERRWTAAQQVGLAAIPAVVRQLTATQRVVLQAVENLQRSDLSVTQEAVLAGRALDLGMTRKDLAAKIGQKPAWLAARLRVLETPTALWRFIDDKTLPLSDLAELRPFVDEHDIIEQLANALREGEPHGGAPAFCTRLAKDAALAAEVAALTEHLCAANITIIEWRGEDRRPADVGYTTLVRLGFDTKAIKRHANEPCHGVAITTNKRTGTVRAVEVCTDAKRHATKGASAVKTTHGTSHAAADEEAKAKERRLRECAAQRDAFSLTAMASLPAADTVTLLASSVIHQCSSEIARLVARQLDLSADSGAGSYVNWHALIGTHAATSAKHTLHVARLIAYHQGVRGMNREHRAVVAHTLAKRGWQPLHREDPLASSVADEPVAATDDPRPGDDPSDDPDGCDTAEPEYAA